VTMHSSRFVPWKIFYTDTDLSLISANGYKHLLIPCGFYGTPSDIAKVANGNILRAIELCENDETSKQNLENFKTLMRHAWKRDVLSIIEWSEFMATQGRESQKNFLSYSLRLLRENLMLSLGQMPNNLVYLAGEEAEFSVKFHPYITRENIYPLSEEFGLAFSHIEANGYAKAVFLDLALKVTRLIR